MPYTTQGFMTHADIAEVRADLDLDLCSCCENGPAALAAVEGDYDDGLCESCGHEPDDHADPTA